MSHYSRQVVYSLLLLLAGIASPAGAQPLKIVAVNYPLAWMAEKLGDDAVYVSTLAPAGEDPAQYSPTRDEILRLQQADLIVLNGAGYEAWTRNAALPFNTVVLTTPEDYWISQEGEHAHRHGPAEGGGSVHRHGAHAFTTWLEPGVAKRQAHAIAQALKNIATNSNNLNSDRIEKQLDEIHSLLNRIDAMQAQAVARDPKRPLLASHPVYQYLVHAYDLNLRSVHWEPGLMPEENQWQALQALLESHPAQHMLWEDEPGAAIRSRLQQLGIQVQVYNPGANPPPETDFPALLHENAEQLRRAFE